MLHHNCGIVSHTIYKPEIRIISPTFKEAKEEYKKTIKTPQLLLTASKEEVTVAQKEISEEKSTTQGLFDLLFEPEDEKYAIKGILYVSPERPVVVLAEKTEEDKYLETLKHILREIYRIKIGGLPRPTVVTIDKRKVEEAEVERHIYVIDDKEDKFFEWFGLTNITDNFEKKANPKKFLERISELFSQQFGFLILYATKKMLRQVEGKLLLVKEQIPKLYKVRLKKLEPDKKIDISSSSWAFVEPPGIFGMSLDKCFLECENMFWEKLETLVKTPKYSWVKESVEEEEGIEGYESTLHYLTKIFIVKYLVEKEKLTPEDIETEVPKGKVVPDIFVLSKNLAIEVETLYGTGITPWRKLRRTLEKYEGLGYKLWIVIPNLQMSLYLKGILELIKELKEKNKPVEFYTLNLENGELIEINKYVKLLSRNLKEAKT